MRPQRAQSESRPHPATNATRIPKLHLRPSKSLFLQCFSQSGHGPNTFFFAGCVFRRVRAFPTEGNQITQMLPSGWGVCQRSLGAPVGKSRKSLSRQSKHCNLSRTSAGVPGTFSVLPQRCPELPLALSPDFAHFGKFGSFRPKSAFCSERPMRKGISKMLKVRRLLADIVLLLKYVLTWPLRFVFVWFS